MAISDDELGNLLDWLESVSIPEEVLWLKPNFKSERPKWVDLSPFYDFYQKTFRAQSKSYINRYRFREALSLLGFTIPLDNRGRVKQSMQKGYRGHPVRFPDQFTIPDRIKYVQLTLF